MKILLITDNFLPHWGGSRVYYYNICRRLPQKEICVLTKYTKDAKIFDRRQSFRIYRVPLFKFPKKIFWIFYELPIYLFLLFGALFVALKERITLIFVGEALPCGLVAFLLKKVLGIPYVVFAHAEDITIVSNLNKERVIQCAVLKNADLIIATCSFIEEFLKQRIGLDYRRVVKIFPAVNEEIINFKLDRDKLSQIKTRLRLDAKKVIFTCCRLIEKKGIDNVIRALPLVIEKIPQVIFLIAGEGEYKKTLEKFVEENGLKDYVRFLGKLNHHEELPYFCSLCDVFIMPSRELESGDIEGFGIVFLEANAFGKPVIGGNTGGTSDSIIDGVTGLRVNSEDVNSITSAVIRILADTDYARRLGEAGRRRAKSEFRWQDRADTIYQISQRIAKGLSG